MSELGQRVTQAIEKSLDGGSDLILDDSVDLETTKMLLARYADRGIAISSDGKTYIATERIAAKTRKYLEMCDVFAKREREE